MKRRFERLREGPFDLLVVGGGIYGAWTAFIAARCGLRVALVEKGDWASGTSSVSSKLIHGGLRYLERLRFGMVRKSLRERALLASLAPHLVRPSRFVIPVYSKGRVGPLRLRAGLGLYRLLAGSDQPGGDPLNLTSADTVERYGFLSEEGLLRAFSYGDAVTDDARLTLEVVEAALEAGAAAVNYAEAVAPLQGGSCAGGAVVCNLADGDTAEVAASVVVNTAGPWAAGIPGCTDIAGKIRLTKGIHLVFPPLPTSDAFLFLTRSDRRVLFLIPWYGRTLVGATDTDYRGSPGSAAVSAADVDYILDELSSVLRDGTWGRESILGVSAGLRTLLEVPGRLPGDLSREWRLFEPAPRLLVSVGGKLTSARPDAAVIVERVLALLKAGTGRTSSACAAPSLRGPEAPYAKWAREMTERGLSAGLDAEPPHTASATEDPSPRSTSLSGATRPWRSASSRTSPSVPPRLSTGLPARWPSTSRTCCEGASPSCFSDRRKGASSRGRQPWRRRIWGGTKSASTRKFPEPCDSGTPPAPCRSHSSMTLAVGLDLGTTGIKAALLEQDVRLGKILRTPAPAVTGEGHFRESDPLEYLERTRDLLGRAVDGLPREIPVGVASQRSTFVLWEKSSGLPVTPLISWQDRRAAAWCDLRRQSAPTVTARTGLPFSPHYAGPKLAQILTDDEGLREGTGKGLILFGTLESWIIWNLSRGKEHVTDISMAARTLLADPAALAWSDELLDIFRVPSACLPSIIRAGECDITLAGGGSVTATIADQPAALLAVLGTGDNAALINLGTGGFILFPSKVRPDALPGYLAGPAGGQEEDLLALEGTINGIGPALVETGESLPFPEKDPAADLFCLAETSGLGSPFWRPDIPQSFSRPGEALTNEDRNRAIREGVIFRVRQIVEDMESFLGGRRLFLSGGIAKDHFLTAGLAACLGRTLYRLTERESTLLGATLLARGLSGGDARAEACSPRPFQGGYLFAKYHRWREWAASMTSPRRDHPR